VGPGGLSLVAQDRAVEQWELREADRPPEVQPPQADLAARLERLPVGHPSSPYRDDGSRKPSPSDLAKYELPLPDELASSAETELANQPRTNADGSWEWKDHKLPPDRSLIADEAIARCCDKEGRDVDGNYGDEGLTPAMRRIETQRVAADHHRKINGCEMPYPEIGYSFHRRVPPRRFLRLFPL